MPKLLSLFCKHIGKGETCRIRRQRLDTVSPSREILQKNAKKECSGVGKNNARLQGRKQHLQRWSPFANCRWKCHSPHISVTINFKSREWWRFQPPSKITSMWVPWRRRPPHGINYDEFWLGSGFSNSFFFFFKRLTSAVMAIRFVRRELFCLNLCHFFHHHNGKGCRKKYSDDLEPQSRFPGSRQGRFLHRSCIEARCHKVFQHGFQARKPKNI